MVNLDFLLNHDEKCECEDKDALVSDEANDQVPEADSLALLSTVEIVSANLDSGHDEDKKASPTRNVA